MQLDERLYVDDGEPWRTRLRECAADELDAAVEEARRQIRGHDAAVDVLASIISAASLHDRDDLLASTRRELVSVLSAGPSDPDHLAARERALFDAALLASRFPPSGVALRALASTERARAAPRAMLENLAAHVEELAATRDANEARYLLARVRLRLGGGADARPAVVREALLEATRPFRTSTPKPHHTRRLLRALIRELGDSCEDISELALAAHALHTWASLDRVPGEMELAVECMRRALAHFELEHANPPLIEESRVLTDLSAMLREQGEVAEAEELLRRSLMLARAVGGLDHPQALVTEAHLGGLLVDAKRFMEAVELLEPLRARRIAHLRASEGAYVTSVRLAEAYQGLARFHDAEVILRDAVAIAQEAALMSFEARDALADLLDEVGRGEEAADWRDWSIARDKFGLAH